VSFVAHTLLPVAHDPQQAGTLSQSIEVIAFCALVDVSLRLFEADQFCWLLFKGEFCGVLTGWPCSASATRLTTTFCLKLAMAQK
jgi:hypothetical protein